MKSIIESRWTGKTFCQSFLFRWSFTSHLLGRLSRWIYIDLLKDENVILNYSSSFWSLKSIWKIKWDFYIRCKYKIKIERFIYKWIFKEISLVEIKTFSHFNISIAPSSNRWDRFLYQILTLRKYFELCDRWFISCNIDWWFKYVKIQRNYVIIWPSLQRFQFSLAKRKFGLWTLLGIRETHECPTMSIF